MRDTTTQQAQPAKSRWRWLLLVYYLLVIVGLTLFEGRVDTPLALALAAALSAQVVWSAVVVVRAEWTLARRALAVVGLALGILSIASPLLVTALGWSRGLPALYGWERRFEYAITPGWSYIGLILLTSPALGNMTPTGSWLVRTAQTARRYPWHLASAAAAGLALCFSGVLLLQVSKAFADPFIDVALALVAVQIGILIHGLRVYPWRHQTAGPGTGAPAPWMAAFCWGWALGFWLALLLD